MGAWSKQFLTPFPSTRSRKSIHSWLTWENTSSSYLGRRRPQGRRSAWLKRARPLSIAWLATPSSATSCKSKTDTMATSFWTARVMSSTWTLDLCFPIHLEIWTSKQLLSSLPKNMWMWWVDRDPKALPSFRTWWWKAFWLSESTLKRSSPSLRWQWFLGLTCLVSQETGFWSSCGGGSDRTSPQRTASSSCWTWSTSPLTTGEPAGTTSIRGTPSEYSDWFH